MVGGPQGDCGLTGRKIIVDTYGGMGRTAAARSPARTRPRSTARRPTRRATSPRTSSRPGSRAAARCSSPTRSASPSRSACTSTTFGTGKVADDRIAKLVREHFDLPPKGIIETLDLLRPIYRKTASYGHFGRDEPEFTWEKTDKAAFLAAEAGLEEPRHRVSGPLSASQLAQYRRDGFLVLPGFVPAERCLALRERAIALAREHVPPPGQATVFTADGRALHAAEQYFLTSGEAIR